MAQDGEVNVKVKVTAENGGVTKVESGLDKIGKKAKETAEKTKSGFEQANQTFGKVTKAAGAFQKILSGFGMIGIATALVGGIKKIIDSFGKAKEEAEAFAKAADDKKVKDGIDALKDSYIALKDAIADANAARTAQKEIEDIELKNKRDLEDANIDLAEQKELDAIDAKDPAAAEARAEIQARYKAKRDNLAVQRGIFDGVRERQDLQQGAIADRENADKIDAAANETQKKIAEAKARKNAALARSTAMNSEDDDGNYFSQAKNSIGKIFTLEWGRLGDYRTDKGDAIREEAQAEVEKEQARIEQLEGELTAQRKQAEDLRTSAGQKDRKAEALGGSVEAQRVREQVVSMQGTASVAAAVRATDAKDKEADDKAAKEADAITAAENLQREKSAAEQRKAEAEQRRAAAQRAQFEAQSNFDLAKANKGDVGSAAKQLDEAKRNAAAVDRETTALISSLDQTLRNIEGRLKAANNEIRKDQSQAQYAWSQQPAG